jgi:hypothetical protein
VILSRIFLTSESVRTVRDILRENLGRAYDSLGYAWLIKYSRATRDVPFRALKSMTLHGRAEFSLEPILKSPEGGRSCSFSIQAITLPTPTLPYLRLL